MSFFDSDIVRAEMAEIHELQEEVYDNVMKFPYMNDSDKLHHINILEKLIEKQKIVYARLSLSDDPDAKQMKEEILKSAVMMGLPKNVDVNLMFNQMSDMMKVMRQQLDTNGVGS
jgi:glycine cleavage system regulatory protein